MTECQTPEMQDLLPDYVSASLDATTTALLEQHLVICDPCREDIALLRVARMVRPRAVTLDVARIAASLARQQTLVPQRRRWSASVWQVAAALGMMIVGGASVIVARNSPKSLTGVRSSAAQSAEIAEQAMGSASTASGPSSTTTMAALDSPANVGGAARSSRVSVSYGDLGDYSAAELQHMLDRLEKWDGTSSADPLPMLPVIAPNGGTTP